MNTAGILLVEDEPYARREITKLINGCEDLCVYAIATNLAERRQRLFDDYDLLVADKQWPDGSGIDLMGELNQRPHNKRTLMMTVFEDERTVLEAIESGVDGYMVNGGRYSPSERRSHSTLYEQDVDADGTPELKRIREFNEKDQVTLFRVEQASNNYVREETFSYDLDGKPLQRVVTTNSNRTENDSVSTYTAEYDDWTIGNASVPEFYLFDET